MKSVFLQVLELCREVGLIRLGLVALAGTQAEGFQRGAGHLADTAPASHASYGRIGPDGSCGKLEDCRSRTACENSDGARSAGRGRRNRRASSR